MPPSVRFYAWSLKIIPMADDHVFFIPRRIRLSICERNITLPKRRTRAVQVFPSMESMIRLVGAVMAEADEDWSTRRCMATMDALEREAPPEPAIDAETRLRAERLVMVAMESAGVAPRAA